MLTDLQCKSPPADGKSKLFDGHGLYLEILKSGARSWRWKYRIHGKEKRLTFGLYPDVSLKKARIAREQAAALLRTGVDPSIDRVLQAAQAAAQGEHTFKSVALTWHASQVPLFKPTHAKHVLRTLENDVFPAIGKMPIAQVPPGSDIAAAENPSAAMTLCREFQRGLHTLLDARHERHRRRRLAFLAPVGALRFRTRPAKHQVRYARLLAFGCESRRCLVSR